MWSTDGCRVSKTRVGSIDSNCEGHNYEITVSTGTFRGSGTTANVAMVIHDIGDVHYIRIWHNNEGEDPAWFLRQINIRDVATNKAWLFIHNDWFAVDKATVVLFYSMMWGTDKSNGWMTSVVLSLAQDILVVQPLKVVVLAMLLSLIFRKPPVDDDDQSTNEQTKEHAMTDNASGKDAVCTVEFASDPKANFEPLDCQEVLEAQAYQVKKNTIHSTLKEIVLHLVFVMLLSFILFGSQSPHRYRIHKHLNDIFPKSYKVSEASKFWWWCDTVLLPGLYRNEWYNGQNFTDEKQGFISDKRAVLISMPRLRQSRVKSENCEVTKDYSKLQDMFPVCFPHYSLSKADESSPTTSNNPKGDAKLNDSVMNGEIGFERMCLQPFMVQSASKLGTLPVVTNDRTYSGSGMVADLGYDYATAKEVVVNLKEDRWIDRQTRAIFVEFVVFEPTTLLYAFARFTFEQQPTGSILPSYRIEPFALYGVGQSSFKAVMSFVQLILLLFIIILFVREIVKLARKKKQFFKDFWNIHQVIMLSLSLAMMSLNFVRESYVRKLIQAIQDNPYSRMSFDYVQYGTDVFTALAGVVIFLATIKLLKLFNFNMKIQTFVHVMKLSRPFLMSYTLIFCVTFLAFAQAGNLIFGQSLIMYSNIIRSFVNVFQMALGKGLFFHDLKDIDSTMGPLFIFCYFIVTTLLLINFFVAILNDSYVDGCETVSDGTNEDAIMSAFMAAYIKSSLKDISKELKEIPIKPRKSRSTQDDPETQRAREVDYFLY
ncbi:hypothetical protein QZH41_005844 [Actinostola sp. cb2023]|nr:hypothetical protein QZH41_005844 [Actinostola sp. cb2023]